MMYRGVLFLAMALPTLEWVLVEITEYVFGICTQIRRRTLNTSGCSRELNWESGHPDATVTWMGDVDNHFLCEDLRVLKHFSEIHHSSARTACIVDGRDPVCNRP